MSQPQTPTEADDEVVVEGINRRAGTQLRVVGRSSAGTLGGAIYVEWPDGRAGVVTRFLGPLHEARRTASVLAQARSVGLPIPRHDLVVEGDHGVLIIQERLPGSAPSELTPTVIDAIVEVNDHMANLLHRRREVPILPLCLDCSGDPYPKHEVLAAHGTRSRRVLEAIRAIGRAGPRTMTGTDLVHIDLTPPNLLFDDITGDISAIVDWNLGAHRGDRHLALVKTRFEQEWALHSANPKPAEAAAAAHLDNILRHRVPPATLHAYWAHRMLYQLHFALQFAPPDIVKWHLEVAETRLLQAFPWKGS